MPGSPESNEPMFAVLFPGQGAQFVGMGADVFEDGPSWLGSPAMSVLDWSLAELCREGPEERLTRTEFAQPALYAVSLALWEVLAGALAEAGLSPAAMAGHSLGEYTALAAAGAFAPLDGLAVVAERGRAMAEAADRSDSGMAALIGATVESAEAMCAGRRADGGRLWVANMNAPGQVVVAGMAEDIDWTAREGKSFGMRRVIPLAVAGAFHTPVMDPARQRLVAALDTLEPAAAAPPVWSNVTAAPHTVETMAPTLARQVVEPVRFEETLLGLREQGVTAFVHVGPGDVTAGLARRTVGDATIVTVNELKAIPEAVDRLGVLGTMPAPEEA